MRCAVLPQIDSYDHFAETTNFPNKKEERGRPRTSAAEEPVTPVIKI